MKLPPVQESLRARCLHPTGKFAELSKTDIETSVALRFEKLASEYPQRTAVTTVNCSLTYAELNITANRIAHLLLSYSSKVQEPVAVLLEHGADLIAAMLGIWKADKIYVPLDPDLPESRNKAHLEESQATLLLTNARHRIDASRIQSDIRSILIDEIFDVPDRERSPASGSPDSIAYILFTSGSTGRPKGVFQSHRNLLHQIRKETNGLHICADDKLVLLRSCSAIGGVRVALSALLNGGSVHPFDLKQSTYADLAEFLAREQITIFDSTPTAFRQCVEVLKNKPHLSDLRLIRLSSETVHNKDVDLYKKHFPEPCILANSLGVTEAGGSIRLFLIDHDTTIESGEVPVGYGIEEVEVVLLDERGQEVAAGDIGEISVRGEYLSLGYWRQPELTRAKFVADSGRDKMFLYRSGDRGRFLADGCLVYLAARTFKQKSADTRST
jgi:amino acid adenylation domain-containing protein